MKARSSKQVIKETSHVLTFGTHKGHSVDTVLSEDPGYILWLSEQDWIEVDEKIVEMAKEYDWEENNDFYDDLRGMTMSDIC